MGVLERRPLVGYHVPCAIPAGLDSMKLIIAIIQPAKLEEVKTALSDVEVVRLTIMDVQGFGRQKGQTELYRGHEISVNLLRKVQLQIADDRRDRQGRPNWCFRRSGRRQNLRTAHG